MSETLSDAPEISVPDIRDYERINAEAARLLDGGAPLVRLVGVQGQRLLLWGLAGPWTATIEVEGSPGPEFAAELNAPNLTIVCGGSTADAPGRGLKAGRLRIQGRAGDAAGYGQSGGIIAVLGPAGHRAGLMMAGGVLALAGGAGRLAGERQSGGLILLKGSESAHRSRGQSGGRLILFDPGPISSEDLAVFQQAVDNDS